MCTVFTKLNGKRYLSDMDVWTLSDDLAYTCNPQITVYRSLLYIQGPGLARKFYLKQKNMKNAKKSDLSL